MATGSARSVKGFNVYEAISACSDLLTQFGGHKYAAGLTMELDNIQHFIERFEAVVSTTINRNDLVPKINIDAKVNFDEIDLKFFRIMERMEPFGPGNPAPTFVSEDVFCKSVRVVGENHLKMFLAQMGSKNKFEAIAFKMSGFENEVSRKKPFNIAFHLELNDFQGEESLQLVIKDMKFKD
jgi:single-stranded-DNA-specific exonuclease